MVWSNTNNASPTDPIYVYLYDVTGIDYTNPDTSARTLLATITTTTGATNIAQVSSYEDTTNFPIIPADTSGSRQFTFRLEDEGTGAGNGITLLSVTLGFSVSL